MPPDFNSPQRKKVPLLFFLGGVVVLAVLGLMIWRNLQFHIVSTTPSLKNFAAISPQIEIKFNRLLSSDASVSIDSGVKNSYSVSGKSLTIRMEGPLTVGHVYKITLQSVISKDGAKIQNKILSFTAKDIPLQKMPKDQQQEIMQQQTNTPKPYRERLAFNGTEELIRQGLSAKQIAGFEQAIFNYSTQIGKEFNTISIDTKSVTTGPSPANDGNFSATFVVQFDQQKLNAELDYFGLSQIRLHLFDANNHEIFDSQNLTSD